MNKTPEELQAEREEKARKALEERNIDVVNRRNAIADALDEQRDEDMVDVEETIKEKEEAPEVDSEIQAEPEAESDTKDIDGVTYYKVVVNGKEKWQTLEQIKEAAQKVDSADQYLEAAKEAARVAASEPPKKEDEFDYESLLNNALMGDQEAVKKLAQAFKAKPSDKTDVLQAVDERMTFREAVSWFDHEYADELKDPMLKKLIVEEDARLARDNPTMPYKQRLQKAGDSVRQWATGFKGSTPKVDKLSRKASAPSIPSAAGRQQMNQDEEAEESVESLIAKMAQSRGQNRAIKH